MEQRRYAVVKFYDHSYGKHGISEVTAVGLICDELSDNTQLILQTWRHEPIGELYDPDSTNHEYISIVRAAILGMDILCHVADIDIEVDEIAEA